MAYEDVKLVKLVGGELVLGQWAEGSDVIKNPAILQTVPTQQGVSMMLMPYGYPFETEIKGEIEARHVLYTYDSCPDELTTKYMEAKSNLTLSGPGDLQTLNDLAQSTGGDLSTLLKK